MVNERLLTPSQTLRSVDIIGALFARFAAAKIWEFAAFRESELLLSGASAGRMPDVTLLRIALQKQRLAGEELPNVTHTLGADHGRSLYILFGEFRQRIVVMRLYRTEPFTDYEGSGIAAYLAEHESATIAAIFDGNAVGNVRVAANRVDPLTFVIDESGTVVGSGDEEVDDPHGLRTQFVVVGDRPSPFLAPIVGALLEAYRGGATGKRLIAISPFALVRLMPLRGTGPKHFIVMVELMRSRASLESTALQYAISKRELQVLTAMLRGASVATIAAELSISESTVVFHLKRMLKKTSTRNRPELAACMLGWQSPT